MPILVVVLIALVGLYTIGRYETTVTALVGVGFGIITIPLRQLVRAIRVTRLRIAAFTATCFEQAAPLLPEERQRGVWWGWRLVGAVLFLVATGFFLYVDFWVMSLTLSALDFAGAAEVYPPVGADQLMALALVAIAVFWGAVLLDTIGVSHLGPWGSLAPRGQRAMQWLSLAMVLTTALIAGGAGLWRGLQLAAPVVDASVPTTASASVITYVDPALGVALPAPSTNPAAAAAAPMEAPLVDPRIERLVPLAISAGLPILLTLSAAVSGWGATTSAGLLVGVVGLLATVLLAIAQLLLGMAVSVLDSLLSVAAYLLRLLAATVRNVWNRGATIDPLGGGSLLNPLEAEEPADIEHLRAQGKDGIEAISAAYRRQVFEQLIEQRKDISYDEADEEERGAAAAPEPAGGAPGYPDGALNGGPWSHSG